MRQITTVAALTIAGLILAGCGQSYEDTVTACSTAVHAHDFDTDPLKAGERLPECEDVKEADYLDIITSNTLDDLGWLDDEGNLDKNKMLENTAGTGGAS